MKPILAALGFLLSLLPTAVWADPRTNCWLTAATGAYARVYTNDAMKTAGTTLATWGNGTQVQTNPAYCGVQEVYSSPSWIYVRSTGLASYTMGPWYLTAQHTQMFPSLPVNQRVLFRFPRTSSVPATKTADGVNMIGVFVDGVEMFNSWDAYYWNGSGDVSGSGSGYWNRDAYVNEGASFDPGNAHQQSAGTYHYHADPIGLRYLLGDHVNFNSTTKTYSEDTNAPTRHSPLLGWTEDGYPLYGPYGYASASNALSGVRRMVSGYVLRNGQYGTSNLTANGRSTIPAWAARLFNVSSNQTGPNVSTSYPLGRYMEDNDYLGDHGYVPGRDFDLDEYNGRWCVTPEFPNGTYAYFVAINSNGTPVYPYDIGRGYYGSPLGGVVSDIGETVVTNFLGGTNLVPVMNSPTVAGGKIVLSWSALEGGSYEVQISTNLSNWTTLQTGVSPNRIAGGYTNYASYGQCFCQVGRTAVATFDNAGTTVFAMPAVAPGGSAARGSTVALTITLPSSPPNPGANAPISSVLMTNGVNSLSATNITYATAGTVSAILAIPANTATGTQNVTVTFTSGPTYVLTGGFTIY